MNENQAHGAAVGLGCDLKFEISDLNAPRPTAAPWAFLLDLLRLLQMPIEEDLTLAKHPFRGLVQTFCAIVCVLIVTGVCWSIWAYIAHRRLQAQIDAVVALHQPFFEKDFAVKPLPDDRNAAVLWKAAFTVLPANDDSPSNSNLEYKQYPPFPPAWHQKEDNSIIVNAKLFPLAHLAAAVNEADWGQAARNPFTVFPYYESRAAANILGDAILHAHMNGNDDLAIARAKDLLQLGNAEGKIGTVIAQLVRIGIEALLCERILAITPDLAVDRGPDPFAPALGIAGRFQVAALIRSLLNESGEPQLRAISVDWERMQSHLTFEQEKQRRWTLGPLVDLTEARSLEQRQVDRLAAEAASEAYSVSVYKSHPNAFITPYTTNPPKPGSSAGLAYIYDDFTMVSLSRVTEMEWKDIAERRTAAVALAVRLYRLDHSDRWPSSLAELVPNYLPSVPDDPFKADGTPIGYVIRKKALPDRSHRPMLYWDMTADPGVVPLPAEPSFGWISKRTGIAPQWRDLSRWYPASSP